jgi:NAD(P)-dependent dehydrogenase (short-subunit alcohol dehydrogenase family)
MPIHHELSRPGIRPRFFLTMQRPICLITGATGGVGWATALALAQQGFQVVLAARDPTRAAAVAGEIAALTGGPPPEHLGVDLASLPEVRALAEGFRRRYPRLDVLINNAGVFLPRRTETEDGFETTYQINYLSHFLLTHLLQAELEKSPQGRVINLSSSVYALGRFEVDNLQSERSFSALGTYAASKLYMLMFTRELARRLAGTRVTANAVHPGIVRTHMMLHVPGPMRLMSYLSLPFSISPARGAATSVYLASSPDLSGVSGKYFTRSRPIEARNRFDTAPNRALLWELSAKSIAARATGDARQAG